MDKPTSTVTANVEAALHLAEGVEVSFDDKLEVSLDCCVCCRIGRTIVFDLVARTACCTPTGHTFPGSVERKSVATTESVTTVTYRLQYDSGEFVDPKHQNPSVPHPTWGRIGFTLACPKCGSQEHYSVQNNVARPRIKWCGQCKLPLFESFEEMPWFQLIDGAGVVLYRQERSKFVLMLRGFVELPPATKQVLSEILGVPEQELARRVSRGQPLYEHDNFGISEPLKFSQNLQRMAFALIRCGADFELLHNGRDLKPSYRRRMENDSSPPGS
jgi:hypothetical protein